MSKNALIAIVAVIVIAAAGWFFYTKKGSMMASEKPQTMQSMKELVASGISQKCDFSEPQSNTGGTIYIAGGKVRGDFTSQTESGAVSGHMISDGTTVNTWMDGMTQGIQSSFTMSEGPGNANSQQGLDPDKKTDYTCTPWSADESKFILPAGITFMDVSTMMPGGPNAGTGKNPEPGAAPTKTAQCNACDMAPEPQRTQCRQALNCR
jgi:hypothetical protein